MNMIRWLQSGFGILRLAALLAAILVPADAFAAFGLSNSGGFYTVDTGAGLIFMVQQSSGDITSLKFNGAEYQATDKHSQISSGLGSATVSATTYGTNCIKITCVCINTNEVPSTNTPLTHYLMARNGYPIIYMATYVTAEPNVGELRWITRLQFNKVPNGPPPSNNNGNTGAIESSDVFGYADGHTTSKYYGRHRALELTYSGATGSNIGVWSMFDNPRESSSGGPFYRDIENQGDGAGSDQEVYNYMNSGHEEPEAWRANVLYGPYAMVFTTGAPPALPLDYSWIDTGGLNLMGYVAATNRGAIKGVVSGIPGAFQGVIGFANTTAQYWAVAGTNGTYLTPLMKPGTYTAILYKGELPVATNNNVIVSVGATNTLNFASTETLPNSIFRIGEWDGTPLELLNGSNIVNLHPQDVRNANWGPTTYTVGVNSPSDFPAIQMRGTNTPTTILFNLAGNQLSNSTLRIGMTCAYNGGRPQVTINGHALSFPGASSQPNSRSFTVGTWRGNDINETYALPAADLVAGQNTISINPVSGSGDLGPWLSAGWVYDAVELYVPNSAPAAPEAPGGLMAVTATSEQNILTWTSHSTNEINFLVERSTDGANFTLIAALAADITNYADTNGPFTTTYYYRVRAANPGGASPYSNVAAPPPLAVTSFSADGLAVTLNGSGGAAGYPYYLLASTNVSLPLSQWDRVVTNVFDALGNFAITNPLALGSSAKFYLLQLP